MICITQIWRFKRLAYFGGERKIKKQREKGEEGRRPEDVELVTGFSGHVISTASSLCKGRKNEE